METRAQIPRVIRRLRRISAKSVVQLAAESGRTAFAACDIPSFLATVINEQLLYGTLQIDTIESCKVS